MGSREEQLSNGSTEGFESPTLEGLRRAISTSTSIGTQASETNDGCIVLGMDAGRGNKYVTRFRIRRDLQLRSLTGDVCKEECCPCTLGENRTSCGKFFWTLINCEPLLLTLHLTVIIFGSMKAGLNLSVVAEDLHIAASTIETLIAMQIVVSRIVGSWMGYKSLSMERKKVEYVEPGEVIHTPTLRRAVQGVTVVGIVLCLGLAVAYALFFHFGHLTWTILSNNFAIIIITASSGLLTGRINAELAGISQDHHKAVIYESMLLLTECVYSKKSESMIAKIDRFCKALRDTNYFEKPDYIDIPKDQRLRVNLISNVELQSYV